ncbi:MAG: cytochrome c, partial [Planctomycetota bacterium]
CDGIHLVIGHYVVYLAMRGETERALVDDAVYELDLEGGDRWFATEEIDADPSLMNDGDLNQESWEIVEEITADILTEWVGAEDTMIQVQRPDTANIPVPETIVELQNALKGKDAGPLKQSIARGREVYLGVNASCSKCHGKEGLGNGQVTDYDDWTRDYTERVKIKPTDHAALQPLYVRGALKPQNILPRNFTEGIYRSGDDVDAMFRKIVQGIAGSPMPASTFVEGKYTEADVWHLINFLRSLAPPIEVEPPREST